ncbi:hypothetical protein VTJ04DRAFT_5106 [Mycothermus thermophilus]|uniref:uncharacterized protein n=1 Tax=Humicola insolens TaxID=85995 RepID=UPI003742443F
MCSTDCFLALLAVLFPPLPVWVKRGICSADSIINILLLILGYIPGLLHAWYIIAKYPDPYDIYQPLHDHEHGHAGHAGHAHGGSRPIYVFVPGHPGGPPAYRQQPAPHGPMNYGTTSAPAPSYPAAGAPARSACDQHCAQHHAPQEQGTTSAAGPSDGAAPPSYAQVVAGDYKVQTRD